MVKSKFLIVLITLVFLTQLVSSAIANEDPIKAYRNINFGEPYEIVMEKAEQDPEIDPWWTEDWRDVGFTKEGEIEIGSLCANVEISEDNYDLCFEFFHKKLYRLQFSGSGYAASYFDTTVKKQRDTLVAVISKKYGEASWVNSLDFFDVKEGYMAWSHIWRKDKTNVEKEIKIGIGCSSYKYYGGMFITYLPLQKAKEQEEKKEEEKEKEENSEDF